MDNIYKNFREFVQKSMDEIIENDERCISINNEILKLEKELLPLLTIEVKNKILKIDELTSELTNHIPIILFRRFYDNYDKFTINLGGGNTKY